MLSKKQLTDVCLAFSRSHKCCRYLAQDETEYGKYYCMKKSPKKVQIDVEIEDFIRDAKKKGKDPKKDNLPLGDNCGGYPILRHIEQGYDQKP